MKKSKILLALAGLVSVLTANAQDKLLLAKRDYSGDNTEYTLQQVNVSTGAQTKFHDFQDYGTSYLPDYLVYHAASKNIVGIAYPKKAVVVNAESNVETAFTLATESRLDYREVIAAGDKVYIIKYVYSTDTEPSKYYLMSLNTTTGVETQVYQFQTDLNQLRSATYLSASNEIVIVRGMSNILIKYNITTNTETTYNLDQTSGTDYRDMIVAKGKIYSVKSSFNEETSSSEYNLIELDVVNKVEHQVHKFAKSAAWGASLAYLPKTDDLFVLMSSGSNYLVNYNLTSDTEVNTFTLEDDDIDFGDLIVIPEEIPLAVSDEVLAKSVNVYPNPTKDILNLTKQVNSVKVYDLNSVLLLSAENTQSVDISALPNGLYIIDTDNQKQKIVVAK